MPDSSSSSEEEFLGDEDQEEGQDDSGENDEDNEKDTQQPKMLLEGRKVNGRRSSAVAAAEKIMAEESDDSDDDIPLAALVKKSNKKDHSKVSGTKRAATQKKKNVEQTKSKTNTNRKESEKKKSKNSSTSNAATAVSVSKSNSGDKTYEWESAALYGTESTKGLLIQRLLCRWWYAMQWPDQSTIPSKPPENYDSLDGFPGVFVCTEGEKVGEIKDFRDPSKAPSFKNFTKMSSAELQKLLLTALQKQKDQLVEMEGKGTATEKSIDELLKWTHRVNPEKADKEAVKVLKANGF